MYKHLVSKINSEIAQERQRGKTKHTPLDIKRIVDEMSMDDFNAQKIAAELHKRDTQQAAQMASTLQKIDTEQARRQKQVRISQPETAPTSVPTPTSVSAPLPRRARGPFAAIAPTSVPGKVTTPTTSVPAKVSTPTTPVPPVSASNFRCYIQFFWNCAKILDLFDFKFIFLMVYF